MAIPNSHQGKEEQAPECIRPAQALRNYTAGQRPRHVRSATMHWVHSTRHITQTARVVQRIFFPPRTWHRLSWLHPTTVVTDSHNCAVTAQLPSKFRHESTRPPLGAGTRVEQTCRGWKV